MVDYNAKLGDEFPAPTGINRSLAFRVSADTRVPRTHGDKPFFDTVVGNMQLSSPHPRG